MALEPITRQEQIIAGKDLEPITRMEKFLKQYGGGSGGGASVQSDLAQNDPAAPDYVKNRTHWVEKRESILADQTIRSEEYFANPFDIVVGQKYTVVYNGTTYEVTAKEHETIGAYIGQFPPPFDEYPFAIAQIGQGTSIMMEDDTATVRITTFGEIFHKINSKFLPVASETEIGGIKLSKLFEYTFTHITLEVGVTKKSDYSEKSSYALVVTRYDTGRKYFAPFGGRFAHNDENGNLVSNANRIPALSSIGKATNLVLTWNADGVLKSVTEVDAT